MRIHVPKFVPRMLDLVGRAIHSETTLKVLQFQTYKQKAECQYYYYDKKGMNNSEYCVKLIDSNNTNYTPPRANFRTKPHPTPEERWTVVALPRL